jgi:putative SOS response-associated peptidase YedK
LGPRPSWWKKPLKELPATFNARAETLAERPMFRGAFKPPLHHSGFWFL